MDGVEVTPLFKRMVEIIGYPYQVFSGDDVSQNQVMDIYQKSLRNGKIRGFVPVFVSDDVLTICMEEWENETDLSYGRYVKRRIDAMELPDNGKEIADKKFMELTQPMEEYETYGLEELTGKIAGGERQQYFESVASDIRFCLFEVPLDHPWEGLLYIPNVIWEEYVNTGEVLAICKYWYEKYRALPAFISVDRIEFALPEPVPESEAFDVAKQIYAFCDETLPMKTESDTLGELADSIRQSTVWDLWWE